MRLSGLYMCGQEDMSAFSAGIAQMVSIQVVEMDACFVDDEAVSRLALDVTRNAGAFS